MQQIFVFLEKLLSNSGTKISDRADEEFYKALSLNQPAPPVDPERQFSASKFMLAFPGGRKECSHDGKIRQQLQDLIELNRNTESLLSSDAG